MTHAESWHARCLPRIGSPVYHACDPRHVGEVVAIIASVTAVIVWDNGWKSYLLVDELRRA
jgi:hypothetical protein